jgi:hypothetical protein
MTTATMEDIAELLGDRADDVAVERIANLGASEAEVAEAIDDYDYERRLGEPRMAASPKIEEIRQILEELLGFEEAEAPPPVRDDEEDEFQGLTVVDPEALGAESQ